MSVSIVVQVPAPAGERWKTTEATPPASVAVAVRATVARRLAPGSVRATTGAVLLTPTAVVDESRVLPAASVTRAIRV